MKTSDVYDALKPVADIFETLSISYCVGGSVASSIYGVARTTMDIDIVANIEYHHIPALKQYLEKDYYINENMIKEAIRNTSSFNLIHFETVLKIDVFIYKDDPYQRSVIRRRLKDTLQGDDSDKKFFFSSPEDIIINKLMWYKMSEKTSERQWLDVLGVIKVQAGSLDTSYLKEWSRQLQVFELLDKAYHESGIVF